MRMRNGISTFLPAAGVTVSLVSLVAFVLTLLTISSFHHGLGEDNASLRKGNIQKRSQKPKVCFVNIELQEESKGPFPQAVGQLVKNRSLDRTLQYSISGPNVDNEMFFIKDDDIGRIYVRRSVDREKTTSFTFVFYTTKRSTKEIVDTAVVEIHITDINDNAPEFPRKEFNITMKENHKQDEPVFNVTASDKDEVGTANSRVVYSLVWQMPYSREPHFTIDSSSGLIYVSGCADYQKGPRTFRLLIKATDQGIPQMSSTAMLNIAIEDSNNHRPVFTKEKLWLNISEGAMSDDVLRLSVEDGDSPNTPAWKAKYTIEMGNESGNYKVTTDPKSNEGVLGIMKPLHYDGTSGRRLVISVENEEPLFSCAGGRVRTLIVPHPTAVVNIEVISRNVPPQFNPPVLFLPQPAGVGTGIFLVQYTARDPDALTNTIRYKISYDPAGWVTIDENSGSLTTVKRLYRESPYVDNDIYTIVIHAVDSGIPPLTGTGTIQLYLFSPGSSACDGKGKDSLVIKVEHKDSYPYLKPYMFHLADSMKNFWSLGETFDDSVELLMQRSLPLGEYSVPLRISDQQGASRMQNVDIRVCSCLDGSTCAVVKSDSFSFAIGSSTIITVLVAVVFFIVFIGLLLWYRFRCKAGKVIVSFPDEGGQTLICYNEESQNPSHQGNNMFLAKPQMNTHHPDGKAVSRPTQDPPMTNPTLVQERHIHLRNHETFWKKSYDLFTQNLGEMLNHRLNYLAILEDNMGSYPPHVYAEEGSESVYSLSVKADDDDSPPPGFLHTLGPLFVTRRNQ